MAPPARTGGMDEEVPMFATHRRRAAVLSLCPPILLTLVLVACTTEAPGPAVSESTLDAAGPNILLIIADDVGIAEVGAYADPEDPAITGADPWNTPNIDTLANDGVRFDRAWANPVCSPTRATIYTGNYGFETGIGNVGGDLEDADVTLAEVLAAAGYETALFGKWHLGEDTCSPNGDLDGDGVAEGVGGFDHFAGSLGGALNEGGGDYDEWFRTVNCTQDWSYEYATTKNVTDALAWIGDRSGPWMATVAFNAAHTPIHKPDNSLHTLDRIPATCRSKRKCYQAMIEAMDTEIGNLLAGFDRTNTWVFFAGDNGTPRNVADPDVPFVGYKGTVYEGGLRMPLIAYHPDYPGHAVVEGLVNTTDLFATIADIAGADYSSAGTSSVSLRDTLESGAPSTRTEAYAEKFTNGGSVHAGTATAAMRNSQYKVIEQGGELFRCYEISTDEYESNNLAVDTDGDGDVTDDSPSGCVDLWNQMESLHWSP